MPEKTVYFPFTRAQKRQILELVFFLSIAAMAFYIFKTNMALFGIFVYVGLAWLFVTTPSRKISLITGIVGGAVGFFSEFWGCTQHVWNWKLPITTIWMIFGDANGFPVEVVIAYFAAGFWIAKTAHALFKPSTDYTIKFYEARGLQDTVKVRAIMAIVLPIPEIMILLIEPMWTQAMVLTAVGIVIVCFLPNETLKWVLAIGVFMGGVGFFFENFATGGFSADLVVWKYDLSLYAMLRVPNPIVGVAPISAFFAYMGVGLVLFGLSFLLLKRRGFLPKDMRVKAER